MGVGAHGPTMEPAAEPVEEAPKPEPGVNTSFCYVNFHWLLFRTCTSPTLSCGGSACAGSSSQDTNCNAQCCSNTLHLNFSDTSEPLAGLCKDPLFNSATRFNAYLLNLNF